MIHVIADLAIRPGTRDAFLAEFARLAPLVHAERGCLAYAAAVDLPTGLPVQVPAGEDVVVVVEQWESLDALRDHLTAPHMEAWRERVKEMLVGVTLRVLQPA